MEKAWLRFACTSHRKRPRTKDDDEDEKDSSIR
jgi:hypothetical protein